MTTLHPQRTRHGVRWSDFNGNWRYVWFRGLRDVTTGDLCDWRSTEWLNTNVELEQAERSLRQLGHKIGEWDD